MPVFAKSIGAQSALSVTEGAIAAPDLVLGPLWSWITDRWEQQPEDAGFRGEVRGLLGYAGQVTTLGDGWTGAPDTAQISAAPEGMGEPSGTPWILALSRQDAIPPGDGADLRNDPPFVSSDLPDPSQWTPTRWWPAGESQHESA